DTFDTGRPLPMSRQVSHAYADGPSGYTVTVDLTDEDGSYPAVAGKQVTVDNVAPALTLSGADRVDEETARAPSMGPVTDPAHDTVSKCVVRWGDGSSDAFDAAHPLPASRQATHTYADGPSGYTVTVDLTDEDGTYLALASKAVAVDNVAPALTLSGADRVNE